MRKGGILIESSIKRASAIPEFRSGKPFFYAKKQFRFPAMTVEVGHRLGRDDNIVGEKVIGLVVLCVVILDAAQRLRVVGFGLPSGQHDCLVASESCGLVHAA